MNSIGGRIFIAGILATMALSAEARVLRYTASHSQVLEDATGSKTQTVTFVADVWEGDSETALISAGFALAEQRGDILRSVRRLHTVDTEEFTISEKDGVFVQMNANPGENDKAIGIWIAKSGDVDLFCMEFDIALGWKSLKPEVLEEADYRPISRLAGTPLVFENGNLPVAFSEFFANRSARFANLPSVLPKKVITARVDLSAPSWLERQAALDATDDFGGPGLFNFNNYESFSGWESFVPYKTSQREPSEFALKGFDKELKKFMAREDKPSLSDILGFMSQVKKKDPKYDLSKNPFASFFWSPSKTDDMHEAMEKMDDVRERLELAYPGAIWYILGRDAYLFGDALEASYLKIGVTDRVIRLPASDPSFRDVELGTVDGFLKTNGINVDQIHQKSVPQIILDITSYSNTEFRLSQSRHLMRAAYDRWIHLGRDPKDLANKVNFVNVSRMHSHLEVKTGAEVKPFLKELKFVPEPDRIVSVTAPSEFLYTDAWHGLYERFSTLPDGRVVTGHGRASSDDTKMKLLGEMWAVASFYGESILPNGGSGKSCAAKLGPKGK